MAKGFNGNKEGKRRMQVFIDSFLNRMKRMNSIPIQPICNKEEALKRYRTVFWSVWYYQSINKYMNWYHLVRNATPSIGLVSITINISSDSMSVAIIVESQWWCDYHSLFSNCESIIHMYYSRLFIIRNTYPVDEEQFVCS